MQVRINKIAQRRGVLNKLREKTNLSGKILETLNPEFRDIMDNMRKIDDQIRDDADNLKEIYRNAKSFNNRRDYLNCANQLSFFHEKCRLIANELSNFKASLDSKHFNFLLNEFDQNNKNRLFNYDPNAKLERDRFASLNIMLQKNAGIGDWIGENITDPIADVAHNVFSDEGVARRALEKRFSVGFLKQIKAETSKIVMEAGKLLSVLLSTFKGLATALAKRNIKDYVEYSKKFIARFELFHSLFIDYYAKNIKPLKEKWEKDRKEVEDKKTKALEDEANAEREKAKPLTYERNPDFVEPATTDREKIERDLRNKKEQEVSKKIEQENAAKKLEEKKEEALNKLDQKNPDIVSSEAANDNSKQADALFMHYLQSFASKNDFQNMYNTIVNYSKVLENTNKEKSLKLLSVAEGLLIDKVATQLIIKKKDQLNKLSQDFNIPLGHIDEAFDAFPVLAAIQAQSIRITPETEHHIMGILVPKLEELLGDEEKPSSFNFRSKVMSSLRQAIVDGWIVSSAKATDAHNPKDRILEILCNLMLIVFNERTKPIKLRVYCRWSDSNKTLTVKTIQKNFSL